MPELGVYPTDDIFKQVLKVIHARVFTAILFVIEKG